MTPSVPVRVRIAPSPTGYLHLGTIRTALFNYLFAKKEGGSFVVRIEDTDRERSLPIYEQDILNGLRALGLEWNEGPDIQGDYGPYRQSERIEIYEKYLKKLLDEKKAYWCFCTKEELEEEKKAMLASGLFPKYGGACRHLSQKERDEKRSQGREGVIRLLVPSKTDIKFNDIIRGEISVNSDTIGDIVIARSLTSPLYNFAVVVDDEEMKITHVIRGEDHVTNTPKQMLIAKALGFGEPKYAHLPLLLAPDRSKMSKRKMETSFDEYLKEGYLPEALLNFLVLLGWHPEDERELFSLEDMASYFSLKRVQKSGAVFNVEKLDWFNAQYIKNLPIDVLLERLRDFLPEEWYAEEEKLLKIIVLERGRVKKLSEFEEGMSFFFVPEEFGVDVLRWKDMEMTAVRDNLRLVREALSPVLEKEFTKDFLEELLMPLAQKKGRGEVLWPLRAALSGRKNSPGPFEIMDVLGKKETLARIEHALGMFDQDSMV